MSEHILKSLMQLFGIISRIGGKDGSEGFVVEQFLSNRLNIEETDKYLQLFEKHSKGPSKSRISVADSSKMMLICTSINEELTQQQKYSILMYLFVLVNSDEHVDKQEREFLQSVAEVFNIDYILYQRIEHFCLSPDLVQNEHESFLIIDGHKNSKLKTAKHLHKEHLEGHFAFMQVPGLNIFLAKYVGKASYMINGQIMENNRATTFAIGSVIRGENIAPIYFTDISAQFLVNQLGTEISFEARNISYCLKDGRPLLHELSLSETNQSLVAIMGPSGAGKSTLLETLNGIRRPSTGAVFINKYNLHDNPAFAKSMIGYVPQDDLLIEELTVYENLYYAAKLCYGSYSEEQLDGVVNQTLDDLGLAEIKTYRVGHPLQKVISGGERKRVNIGLELLRQPPVMFIDEPTSGLSSSDSLNIMSGLKELALKGKIVFTVIHQPSSDIFKLFDKLVLLDTGGYPIFYGHPLDSLVYFRGRVNQINKEKAVCPECGNVNNEQIFDIIEAKTVSEQGYFTKNRRVSPQQWNKWFWEHAPQVVFKTKTSELTSEQSIAGRLKQFMVFAVRDLKSKLANKQYMAINLLQAPILAFLLAMLNRYSPGDEYVFGENENIPVFFFISVITALFMGLVGSAEEIYKDRKILKREQFLDLSRTSYLFSKVLILFGFSAVQTLTFVAISSVALDIRDMFMPYWLIMFSISCFANLTGLNISASFNSAVTIYILIPILIIPQLVLGGVVIDFKKLNHAFRFTDRATPLVGDVMASRWAYEALMVEQFMENPFQKIFYPYEKTVAISEYKKLYKFPELRNHLYFIEDHRLDPDVSRATLEYRAEIIKRNFRAEIEAFGMELDWVYDPAVELPDSVQVNKTLHLLYSIEKFIDRSIGEYNDRKFEAKEALADKTGSYKKLKSLKANYYNERIARIVKNMDSENRMILDEAHIVPNIYPIYMEPEPLNLLDYRTFMYYPHKHFLGFLFPTLIFNALVIWTMTMFLFVALYFNLLRKAIDWMGNQRLLTKLKV